MPHIPIGTKVRIKYPIREGDKAWDVGEITGRNGESYEIMIEYDGEWAKVYPKGILVDRYLSELEMVE